MSYSKDFWAEKREKGLARYLMFDGILFTGGPFAVVMQIIGVFVLRDAGQTIGQYFMAPLTWMTFFFHSTLFGLIVGFLNWRRNEKSFAMRDEDGQNSD